LIYFYSCQPCASYHILNQSSAIIDYSGLKCSMGKLYRKTIFQEVVSTEHKTPHSFERRDFSGRSILPSRQVKGFLILNRRVVTPAYFEISSIDF